jgi:hypothetical protein
MSDLQDKDKITCYGCLTHQFNQLAHMDFGGCLYINFNNEESLSTNNTKSKPIEENIQKNKYINNTKNRLNL